MHPAVWFIVGVGVGYWALPKVLKSTAAKR
jgi:hypothetical protein